MALAGLPPGGQDGSIRHLVDGILDPDILESDWVAAVRLGTLSAPHVLSKNAMEDRRWLRSQA